MGSLGTCQPCQPCQPCDLQIFTLLFSSKSSLFLRRNSAQTPAAVSSSSLPSSSEDNTDLLWSSCPYPPFVSTSPVSNFLRHSLRNNGPHGPGKQVDSLQNSMLFPLFQIPSTDSSPALQQTINCGCSSFCPHF